MNIGELLNVLESRLPELQWRMGHLDSLIMENSLPPGLFKPALDAHPSFYIDEIKSDIAALASEDSHRIAFFLANRIHQKINVLIGLCKHRQPGTSNIDKIQAVTKMIQSRKQQIDLLETQIDMLDTQKKALQKALEHARNKTEPTMLLNIQGELGAVEKKLTMLEEEKLKLY